MTNNDLPPGNAICILEEQSGLSFEEFCRACGADAGSAVFMELVEEGVLEPTGLSPSDWRFEGSSIRRARVAISLRRDLGVNSAGAALALQLMEELDTLRARLRAMGTD